MDDFLKGCLMSLYSAVRSVRAVIVVGFLTGVRPITCDSTVLTLPVHSSAPHGCARPGSAVSAAHPAGDADSYRACCPVVGCIRS